MLNDLFGASVFALNAIMESISITDSSMFLYILYLLVSVIGVALRIFTLCLGVALRFRIVQVNFMFDYFKIKFKSHFNCA